MSKYRVSITTTITREELSGLSPADLSNAGDEEVFRQTFDDLDVKKVIAFLNAAPRRKRKPKGAT